MAAAALVDSNNNDILSTPACHFNHLEPYVQVHLMKVYGCLSLGMLSAACGTYIHLISNIGEWYFVSTAASVVCILWVVITYYAKETVAERMGVFNAFTFFSGVSSGQLLELIVRIDPSIITTAVSGSVVIFISLSLAAVSSSDRRFASMGVILFSLFFLLILVQIANTYLGSRFIFDVYIYSSLVLFAFFVLYDTQLVVEKRIQGEDDFIWHSVALFLDGFSIFKLVLIILAKKVSQKSRYVECGRR